MSNVERSIEVAVPLATAYDEWTRFEAYPQFMEGVREVRQTDLTHLHWRASVGGREKEWDVEIVELVPDEMIAWRSVDGPRNDGIVTFDPVGEARTRVTMRLDYEAQGVLEKMARLMGVVSSRMAGDLGRFKRLVERDAEVGAWRSAIRGPE